jgi:hypothetical protein
VGACRVLAGATPSVDAMAAARRSHHDQIRMPTVECSTPRFTRALPRPPSCGAAGGIHPVSRLAGPPSMSTLIAPDIVDVAVAYGPTGVPAARPRSDGPGLLSVSPAVS